MRAAQEVPPLTFRVEADGVVLAPGEADPGRGGVLEGGEFNGSEARVRGGSPCRHTNAPHAGFNKANVSPAVHLSNTSTEERIISADTQSVLPDKSKPPDHLAKME